MTKIEKKFEDKDLYTFPEMNIFPDILPATKEVFINDVESSVEQWLRDSIEKELSPIFTVHTLNEDGERILLGDLQFSRSEICIKECANMWAVWYIASSPQWPKVLSVRIKTIGMNDFESEVAPNEILSDNYSI